MKQTNTILEIKIIFYKQYNELTNEIKNEKRMNVFKRKLAEWIKQNVIQL